jgi:uncharacterized protein YbjT (DUF2867 family)
MSTNILITGATGYIGGAILNRLLAHPERSSFYISVIVRSTEKAKKFESDFDVHPIVGSFDDHKLVEDAVAKSDIVVHAVSNVFFCFFCIDCYNKLTVNIIP